MHAIDTSQEPPRFATGLALLLAIGTVALHVLANAASPYGFHRDEFLYVAMGEHLRLWRMDFPPAIAIVANATRAILGDSVTTLRMAPALCHGALVALAMWFAREAGGSRWSQLLAALGVLLAPLYMRAGALFQPVVLDQLTWTLAYAALARLGRTGDARWWLALGSTLGLALLVKFTAAFCAAGITAAVLLTRHRRALLGPSPWLGALLAFAIGAPSIAGQMNLDWPVVAQMRDLQAEQLERVTPGAFLLGPAVILGVAVLLAVAGLVRAWRDAPPHALRPVAIATTTSVLLLLLTRGKPYYAGPVYPALIGIGAAALEQRARRMRRASASHALRWGMVTAIVVLGLLALPFGLPILPPERMARYAAALGPSEAVTTNRGERIALPQDYADMLGWEALAEATARTWRSLGDADRARAVLLATNYGRAGALDLLGRPLGLPPAFAPVGSYWFWGPPDRRGDVTVVVGSSAGELGRFFDDVRVAEVVHNPIGVPEEREVTIHVCRAPKEGLAEVWPQFKGRN